MNAQVPQANGSAQPSVARKMPTRTAKGAKKEEGQVQANGGVSSPNAGPAQTTAASPASVEQGEQLGPGKRKRK